MTHFNHPRELTPESEKALRRLVDAGCGCRAVAPATSRPLGGAALLAALLARRRRRR
jgi:MYXO-CTERM domain-containing protein